MIHLSVVQFDLNFYNEISQCDFNNCSLLLISCTKKDKEDTPSPEPTTFMKMIAIEGDEMNHIGAIQNSSGNILTNVQTYFYDINHVLTSVKNLFVVLNGNGIVIMNRTYPNTKFNSYTWDESKFLAIDNEERIIKFNSHGDAIWTVDNVTVTDMFQPGALLKFKEILTLSTGNYAVISTTEQSFGNLNIGILTINGAGIPQAYTAISGPQKENYISSIANQKKIVICADINFQTMLLFLNEDFTVSDTVLCSNSWITPYIRKYTGAITLCNASGNYEIETLASDGTEILPFNSFHPLNGGFMTYMTVTVEGGYIAGGYTNDFENLSEYIYLEKVNKSGTVQWTTHNESEGNDRVTWILNAGTGYILPGLRGQKLFIAKTNIQGSF